MPFFTPNKASSGALDLVETMGMSTLLFLDVLYSRAAQIWCNMGAVDPQRSFQISELTT